VCVVITHADKRFEQLIASRNLVQAVEHLALRQACLDFEVFAPAYRFRHHLVEQFIHILHAQLLEHDSCVFVARTDMATNESVENIEIL